MSNTESDITPAAVDSTAATTEGVEQPHADVSSNVMIAGEQTCVQCASYAQELALASERNDALTKAMQQMVNDAVVFMTLGHSGEPQMFTARSEAEATIVSLQGEQELLNTRVQQAETDAEHARSELNQLEENNFCDEPQHKVLQDDLDSANCEITELREEEKTRR